MDIRRLETELTRLFPTGGAQETITERDPEILVLVDAVDRNWDRIPHELQERIEAIEVAMCQRQAFSLRLLRWDPVDAEVKKEP